MKPESVSKQREEDEGDCLSPIDEDVSTVAPDGVDLMAAQDHEELINGTDGLVTDDVGSYDVGVDGIISDSLTGSDMPNSANAMRRHRHNIKEKERKEKIKLDMNEIQSLLPPSQVTDKRQTMHELLQLGIQHLRYLSEQNNQLVASGGGNNSELERLRKENEELKLENSRYCGLIAAAGLPVGVDPTQLVITWRYRTLEEINNPFLFAPGGQQMATNVLPTVSVDNSHQQMAQDMNQQFGGQISYAAGDPSTSQYMMYTDLLNSSDPSCMGLAASEQQNGFSTHGTSLVSHNGQLMLVSQSQVPMQTMPMNSCQGNQSADNLGADQQAANFQTANGGGGGESTIDRKQLDESGDGLSLSDVCQTNGAMNCGGSADVGQAAALENSGGSDEAVLVQNTDGGVACPETISVPDVTNASEQPLPVEMQSENTDFFSGGSSTIQPSMTMSNNAIIYRDGNGMTNATFDPSGEQGNLGSTTSTSCSLGVTNSVTDGQLQGNFGGQSVVLHNGQVLLVNQNQNMGTQPLGPSMSGSVIGQDFGAGYCQSANPQLAAANLPLQNASAGANAVFLNKPNQFNSQSMAFFPNQSQALSSALLQPPLASNQTVTVNTPQGPMIMHTLPSKPNEHPQALILPDGQIVPVVTQPNLLFPPQQCIPVTGSLLVPSVTPSRLGPGIMQSAAPNTLTAKLVDGKGQTFALSQNSSVQLGGGNLQSFSNIMPQMLSGIDSSKLCSSAPLQAVPAQGHLPLATLQPCASASKTSRSKKKPTAAMATAKASNLPQSFTAMVMPEGNILLLSGNDVPQTPPASSHTKPSQRTLMPKPMPKSDGMVVQPLVTVPQSSHSGSGPVAGAQLASSQVVSGGQQLMTPLTISLPNQPILPFSCAPVPVTSANSTTDILAQATESLFTISPNGQNQALSEMFSKENDDRLQIDLVGSVGSVAASVQSDGSKLTEKPKKSKKKKSTKTRTVEDPVAMVDQQSISLHLFSPGEKHEEEKESDINDFADLIRMEPPTPAPAKVPEIPDGIPLPSGNEAVTASGNKSSTPPSIVSAADLSIELTLSEPETTKSVAAESFDPPKLESTTATVATIEDLSLLLSPSTDTVPSETPNSAPLSGSAAKSSDGAKTSRTDSSRQSHSAVDKTIPDGVSSRKASPRKKKSNKAIEKSQENDSSKTNKCQNHVVASKTGPSLMDSGVLDQKVETSLKNCEETTSEKVAASSELERNKSCNTVGELAVPKTDKTHVSSRDRKSTRSSGKEKSKAAASLEVEKLPGNDIVCGSNIEADLPEELEDGNRKKFALSNFLPEACKIPDSPRRNETRSCKNQKRPQPIENTTELDPPKLETESVQTTEEATQTVRKELRNRHRNDSESDGRGKKRQKKSSAEQVSEELPETLTFVESEIFDVIDKVENMAAATQTEPKRKSHGRKHKSSCEREGGSSSKRRKKVHNEADASVSVSKESHDVEIVENTSSSKVDEKAKESSVVQQPDLSVPSSKPSNMDVFSFELDDVSAGICESHPIPFKTTGKKSEKTDSLDKDGKIITISEPLDPRASDGPEPLPASSVDETSCASISSASRSKFSFFASSNSDFKSSISNSSKTGSSDPQGSENKSPVEVSQAVTTIDYLPTKSKSADISVGPTPSSVPPDIGGNSLSSAEPFQKNAKPVSAGTWYDLPATKDASSSTVHVPYSKASEVPTCSTALSTSSSILSVTTSAGKVSAGKARHSNIVSLAGSLTPKSAVTKLTSHSQRSKIDREASKESSNTPETENNQKKNHENGTKSETPASNSASSTEVQHQAVVKEMATVETTDNLRGMKPDKEKGRQEKDSGLSSSERHANDSFSADSMSKSNSNQYLPSAPVLSQCAYGETRQKSHTPSSIGSHGTPSGDAGISQPSSRSVYSQKSGSSTSATSSQNGLQSKITSSYNSSGNGLEMERKSWQDETRRRNDADYYAAPMSSSVPSCAVQNKNSAPYSCAPVFQTDKIGMAHQPTDTGNFATGFGGLAQNSFYSRPSSYRGLDQLSPCGGGDGIPRGTMLSCSVDKHSSNTKTGNSSNDTGSLRRDMNKTNQHDSYFTPQFLEPTVSPALGSMNREKSSCLGTSMSSQTSSRQPVPNSSSTAGGRSRSHTRSPSIVDQQGPYSALSGYHGASGSLASSMLHHHSATDYGRYPNNNQHAFGFDMFGATGSQFNPNLAGLTFDPPPLNVFRDCNSVGMQNAGVKKSSSKLPEPGGFEASKSMATSRSTTSQQGSSNQSQSCKSNSNRSASKSSSSSSTKKSIKHSSSSYGMEPSMLDSRSVTPFIGLGSLSPSRTMPPESLSYFAPPNLFGNAGRTLSAAKTLQHRDTPLPLNAALFSPSRAAQNGFGLNFQTGFGMDHVHGSHMGSSQVIAPPPANTMPAHMHSFGFGNIFPDISGAAQRDHLSMSPIKLAGGMDASTLHHHHHQGAGSMYNGRGQLPAHMLTDMGFNPFLGAQHPGFDARGISTPFGGLWT